MKGENETTFGRASNASGTSARLHNCQRRIEALGSPPPTARRISRGLLFLAFSWDQREETA